MRMEVAEATMGRGMLEVMVEGETRVRTILSLRINKVRIRQQITKKTSLTCLIAWSMITLKTVMQREMDKGMDRERVKEKGKLSTTRDNRILENRIMTMLNLNKLHKDKIKSQTQKSPHHIKKRIEPTSKNCQRLTMFPFKKMSLYKSQTLLIAKDKNTINSSETLQRSYLEGTS